MQLSTNFGKSTITSAYIALRILLGTACNSDVYNVIKMKAEIIFMMVYAIHMNLDCHISTRP